MSDKVTMDFNFDDIEKEFNQMGVDIDSVKSKATLKAAKIIKNSLIKNLKRSIKNKYQHSKSKKYVHMADDIKIGSLKTDEDTLDDGREIHGGKYTHYKWKWLEFGTSKMKGIHFITNSLKDTEKEVQYTINKAIQDKLKL